jgi:hypothetical protein
MAAASIQPVRRAAAGADWDFGTTDFLFSAMKDVRLQPDAGPLGPVAAQRSTAATG